ncbi:hypothetical protein JTE90_010127 [Oedothorax gibbosus]|uniref:Ig-like domain-containing protein n=1 Tax=Oedothorax gibbosus TaxID=931172 RepID=A0AAV6UDB3_9ARAC|nr:hypothetical protein JTE90_010127 [Oedothorax gibbosus]
MMPKLCMLKNRFILINTLVLLTKLIDCILSEVITASENQIALLPCTSALALSRSHAKPTLLRWFHSDHHKPIYTLDVRLTNQLTLALNRSAINAKHFPSPDFEGRLYLQLHSSPLTLRIDPVLYGDSGKYSCRVDFKRRRSLVSSVELEVVVPPKEVIIHDQNGRELKGVFGPFNLRETIILTCEAVGGKPSPLLSWSGTFDNSSGDFKVDNTNHSASLHIPCIKREYQWTHLTCTAFNSNITVSKSITVTLEVNLPPLTVTLEKNLEPPLFESQTLTVTCQSNGSHPKAHIRWFLDGFAVASKEIISDGGNIVTSYHKRKVTAADNGKTLECFITNLSISSYFEKRSYFIEVYYKAKVKTSIMKNSNNSVEEGTSITIACSVSSNPKVHQKTWYFDGKAITNSSFMLNKYGNVFIPCLKRTQAGTYTCNASNSEGYSSSSIYLDIKYAPVCKQIEISANDQGRQKTGDISHVTCSLYSNPVTNVTFYWMARNSSSNHSWTTGRDSHAEVWREGDLIELLCWGENEIGMQKVPCRLKIPRGKTKGLYYFEVIVIVCFTVIFSLIVLWVIIRKTCCLNNSETNSARRKNRTATETECLSTLLIADQVNGAGKERNMHKIFPLEEKESCRRLLAEKVALRCTPNDRTRRIKSSQF